MILYYILDGKEPKPVGVSEWERWFAKNREKRIVRKDDIDGVRVSTVFLGIDHGGMRGSPLLFETMIFGGPHDEYQVRYSTWDEAEEGHFKACELAFGLLRAEMLRVKK